MGKIIQLDDMLSNKIAAGEVVERPASVVKELVENAIDAHSTVIEIDVEEAGLQSIRVVDNGDGIEEEDVLTAFERHATSKIKDENDLFRIRTLGFRGEALPSIASVSYLEITTGTGEGAATRAVLEGGKVVRKEKASARKGTEVIVSNLFYNTPARLKYMKTIHTELGNITDTVNRLALAHPDVSIQLRHNGRVLLETNGNGDARQVLAAIYGLNTAKKMIPISARSIDFEIEGWISLPELTRASRNYISTIINGRYVKNYPLVKAIQEGYHTLLPIGRYPIALVMIQMDPLLVDVNVHPSKLEVRLSKEQELNELMMKTIQEAFRSKRLIPLENAAPKWKKEKTVQQSFELDHLPKQTEPIIDTAVPIHRPPELTNTYEKHQEEERHLPEDMLEQEQSELKSSPNFVREYDVQESETVVEAVGDSSLETMESSQRQSRIPPLYPIGQMHGTYILAQNELGLYIIDQHAAQERIKYEFFREKVGQVENELQEMLVPLTLEFSADEYVKILEYKDELEKVGVFLEPFGIHSFIVRAHPQWFPKGEEQEIIEDILQQLITMKTVDIKELREEAAIMMSCKRSIKANHHLRQDEIQALLDDLRKASNPFTCPHGRPVIIHFSAYELEKMFKRVM
ncbi:DNA mismatch repair endonuclease MutL [Bacillus smithii]|uniref:DNA mismatch repair endonuclease MutL n=1 Tax=Bacillus smithii TaxID=1479 RepID=UPI0022E85D91|nr:DNA mismatch repair endonuclease MutL [Bacillus smithii]